MIISINDNNDIGCWEFDYKNIMTIEITQHDQITAIDLNPTQVKELVSFLQEQLHKLNIENGFKE